MPLLTELPVEVLICVMHHCPDIVSAVRLAATSRLLQEIWLDNVANVTMAIPSWSIEDLADEIDYAEAEAVVSKGASADISMTNLNATVRRHLASIERSRFSASLVRSEYMRELKKEMTHFPEPFNMGWKSSNESIDMFPDFRKAVLTIRRLAFGFDHEEFLAAAYAVVHEASDGEVDCLYNVAGLIRYNCEDHWEQMGIPPQEEQESWWSGEPLDTYSTPLCWAFALQTIRLEDRWRFSDESMESKKQDYDWNFSHFGQEKIELMYGNIKYPWAKMCQGPHGRPKSLNISPGSQ